MDYSRRILALDDADLERFVLRWAKVMTTPQYQSVQRFAGAGDMGRDVVGFLTKDLHEGPWHNYQCKQLGRRNLGVGTALLDLGKILHFSNRGKFTLPKQFTYVAPRGLSRPLEELLFNPSALKAAMVGKWNEYCATKIEKGKTIPMDAQLTAHIDTFDFSCVTRRSLDDILTDPAAKPALAAMFGTDPGSPPAGVVPSTVEPTELRYADALMGAYGERDQCTYACHDDIIEHAVHGKHFFEQRERFYAADAFSRFYRDNTLAEEISALEDEMYHGVIEKYREQHADALARVLTYRDPITSRYGELAGDEREILKTSLKDHFFAHLSENSAEGQFVILENIDPPKGIDELGHVEVFYGSQGGGRVGLFPVAPSSLR